MLRRRPSRGVVCARDIGPIVDDGMVNLARPDDELVPAAFAGLFIRFLVAKWMEGSINSGRCNQGQQSAQG